MRSLYSIDSDLTVERAIWLRERRAGDQCREAQAAMRRLDKLLDERNQHTTRRRPTDGTPNETHQGTA